MKVTYYFDLLASIGELDSKLHKSFDGVILDSNDHINLNIYLNNFNSIYITSGDRLRIGIAGQTIGSSIVEFKSLHQIDLPYTVGGDIKRISYSDERYIAFFKGEYYGGGAYLVCDSAVSREVHIPVTGGIYIDSSYIIIRSHKEEVCYDWNTQELWRYKIGDNVRGVNEELSDCGCDIVFNAGHFGDDRTHLVRLRKADGRVVWKKEFDRLVENALVIDNKIYVAQTNQMSILSVDTAEVELSFMVDLPENETGTTLWTDGKLLYVLASQSNQLLCHQLKDGSHIKTYQLPQLPDLMHGSIPYSYKDVNYLGLKPQSGFMAGVEGGMLTWSAEDVLSGKELELEEKPHIITMIIREDDGSQSYYLNIPCDNIHDVLRFGEIEARKIAALRGKQYDNPETRNKKFNGQIKLLIDPAVGEENRPYLDMLAKRCTQFADTMDIKSGNGKAPISVSWAFADEV